MIPLNDYISLIEQTPRKPWKINEDNYFIVYHAISNKYMYFTVNDCFIDPLRPYYTKDNAEFLVETLNSKLKADHAN